MWVLSLVWAPGRRWGAGAPAQGCPEASRGSRLVPEPQAGTEHSFLKTSSFFFRTFF